jgi:hypothetical protein
MKGKTVEGMRPGARIIIRKTKKTIKEEMRQDARTKIGQTMVRREEGTRRGKDWMEWEMFSLVHLLMLFHVHCTT